MKNNKLDNTEKGKASDEKNTPPKEIGGGKEKDPTRYNDWVINGKCVDF
jgi:hypothetical protein